MGVCFLFKRLEVEFIVFLTGLLCLFGYWNNVVVLSTVYSRLQVSPREWDGYKHMEYGRMCSSIRFLVQVIILWVLKILAEKKLLRSFPGLVGGQH